VKMTPPKKTVIKVVRPKAKPGPRGTSEIELIPMKPNGVFKNFCLSDVPSSSQSQRDEDHRAIETVGEHASHVITFDNIDNDPSPDVRETSPPRKIAEVPPLPFMPG
jgi:hypothetical protein